MLAHILGVGRLLASALCDHWAQPALLTDGASGWVLGAEASGVLRGLGLEFTPSLLPVTSSSQISHVEVQILSV